MRTRGERQYVGMPGFAARLYDNLTSVAGVSRGFREIAQFLSARVPAGKLLDVGSGPGRLLREIRCATPTIDLFGLDVSQAMIDLARENLHDLHGIDLRVGNVTATGYPSGFFDCVVSTGSFYNWDRPIAGLNEVFRILKPGSMAYIYESVTDHDRDRLHVDLNRNLHDYGAIRRGLSRHFLRRQLRMTYSTEEIHRLIRQSDFADTYRLERVELGGLPIYVRIDLSKHKQPQPSMESDC
jgi:ubiquinone/menaquinone biosynthesis C-methylase UbiE